MTSRLSPGDGIIVCSLDRSSRAVLPDLQFSYPLKLITSSRRFLDRVQVVWVVGYGGGLVAGDRVRIKVKVEKGSTLLLLTQGSTKVFKARNGRYLSDTPRYHPSTSNSTSPPTIQLYRISVSPESLLILLPSPVTCFSRAKYEQKQVINLEDETSNLILLDWYTSGRMAYGPKVAAKNDVGKRTENGKESSKEEDEGEVWEFDRYRSENEIWINGKRIAKDVLLLEDERPSPSSEQSTTSERRETTYRSRVEPYSCYATLFLFGPLCQQLLAHLTKTFSSLTQYKQSLPFSLIWSFSALEGHPRGQAGIARCAGDSTEAVRDWVCKILEDGGIEELMGKELWKVAFM